CRRAADGPRDGCAKPSGACGRDAPDTAQRQHHAPGQHPDDRGEWPVACGDGARQGSGLAAQHEHHGDHATRADVAAAHDLQSAVAVVARAQAVGGVGKAVPMQTTGSERAGADAQQRGQQGGQPERLTRGGETADEDRQRQHGDGGEQHRATGDAAVHRARSGHRQGGQCPDGEQQGVHGQARTSDSEPMSLMIARAARRTGTACTAPLPSPSRIPRSTIGWSPSDLSAYSWAGSVERWPDSHQAAAPGAISAATSAAAVVNTPSRTTGVLRAAACTTNPAVAAAHALPSAVSRSNGSSNRPCARCSAARTTPTLCARVAGSMPVPPPTTSSGGSPSWAATRADATVVLPMPMSPGISTLAPSAISARAIACPARK